MIVRRFLLITMAAIALGPVAYSAEWGGVTFVVKNVGEAPIRSLVVHVTGKSYAVGDIAPGASTSVRLNPTGESHIELEVADHSRMKIDCYFEHGYGGSVAADLTPDGIVAVKSAITL